MEKWTICNRTGDFEGIRRRFGVSDITARLLVNRRITEETETDAFLHPNEKQLNSPELMTGLSEAVDFITQKIREGRKIRIVGDYDVDGIMATFILFDSLGRAGADVDWYIPHRIRDGYGLNEDIMRTASADGVDTVITCDNGISAVAAGIEAAKAGISLIITDHHEVPDEVPPAEVIVDPKQPGDTYPCHEICGAVVASKLGRTVLKRLGTDVPEDEYLEYMAMATICDVVALRGENRTIAALGMEKLRTTSNLGLSALIRATEIDPQTLSEYHVGFILGPCFNATGRIDDAGLAMELLTAKDAAEAEKLADECRRLNEERKEMTAEQEQKTIEKLEALSSIPKVIVLELEDCHESILGIIAGRIKERYNRPAIIVTMSKGNYKGSGRSVVGYNLFEELTAHKEYLLKFGGHPLAAGMTIEKEKLDGFREALNRDCLLNEEDMCRKIQIDAEVSFQLFTPQVVDEIGMLAPFGQGNPAPLFAERGLRVRGMKYIGRDNSFLRFKVVNSGGYEFTALSFFPADETVAEMNQKFGEAEVAKAFAGAENSIVMTAAFVPRINVFRDMTEVQMNIKALRF